MDKNGAVDFLLNPTVLVAAFIGGSALLLVYVLRLFKIEHDAEEKNQSAPISSTHSERKKESSSGKSKKKSSGDHRWSNRGDKKGFSSPWLLKTLKNHTGQVLNIDYSSSGKYLASCGEEDLDPDPDIDMNTSGSDCNKENSRPSSTDPSPRTKGLSRRQRKNRRREDTSPDRKRKLKIMDSSGARKKIEAESREQCLQLKMSEDVFASLLYKYLLSNEEMFFYGYPMPHKEFSNFAVFYKVHNSAFSNRPQFDVNAREFVPRTRAALRNFDLNDGGQSSSSESSEVESEESSSSEPDFARYRDVTLKSEIAQEMVQQTDINRESAVIGQGIERTCARCGRGFFVTSSEYLTQERCVYHWGKKITVYTAYTKNGIDRLIRYSCCQGKPNSAGCTTSKLHVWSGTTSGMNGPYEGFVRTKFKKSPFRSGANGVYALDCEMCYTVAGMEVTKVTVVGMDGRLVYDAYVRPAFEVVDYNTRFSGITAKHLNEAAKPLKQVQSELRRFIFANTILIGHGLENDLIALKMMHPTVVDTASIFPHCNGFPFRRSLKSLVFSLLQRDVQCNPNGHDSYEDAYACIELMLRKVQTEFLM
ncbi:RNase T domain containing protein [Asbolus verrucosus]|uniref:RNase T domain containing protein n=1 Tax=Asbolus verrucosus TaxID=1661398 RepID=A0A482V8B2_ASBVE|nr:RNase T domain containing protein [Asbolus verrucosus]